MPTPHEKKLLLIIRRSPYGSSLAKACVDVALAAAVFDQKVDLLFVGEGVLQLNPGQDGLLVGTRTMGRVLSSLPLYDVPHVYADAEAATAFNIDISRAPIKTQVLAPQQMQELLLLYEQVVGF